MSKKKWTKESCYEAALECTSRIDFKKKYPSAYAQAIRKIWISEYTWFITTSELRTKWNKETCYEAALKCTSRYDFSKKYPGAYYRALKNSWLSEYTWFTLFKSKSSSKWTKEACYEAALKCTSRTGFERKYPVAYGYALKNSWISEYTWFTPTSELLSKSSSKIKKWTEDICYNAALECNGKKEFYKKCRGAYNVSLKMGWLENYYWFKPTNELLSEVGRKYTYDICKNEALKYTTMKDFREKSPNFYNASVKHNYLKDFDWLVRISSVYDIKDNVYAYIFENLHAIYIGRTINVISRDRNHHTESDKSSVYKYAKDHNIEIPDMIVLETNITVKEGLIKEDYYVNKYREEGWEIINKAKTGLQYGSIGTMSRKWTKKTCYEAALKCKTLTEFRKEYNRAYTVSLKNNWLDDYNWLEKVDIKPKVVLQFTLDGQFIAKYKSVSEACRKYGSTIKDCCKRKGKTAYGFIWRYENDCEFEYILDDESDKHI